MKTQWILLANAGVAQLYGRPSANAALTAVESFSHPDSRLKGRELAGDRPGHERSDNSAAGSRFEPHTPLRRKPQLAFARELAGYLDHALAAGRFDALWLFASSPFLGELKAQLSDGVRQRLQYTQDSDLSALPLRALEARLADLPPLPAR